MKILKSSIGLISKRPYLFIYISVITLIFCIIEYFNPINGIISGMTQLKGNGIIESYFVIIQLILNPSYYPMMIIYLFIALLCCSAIVSLFMTGYLFSLSSAVDAKKHVHGEFFHGFKKYFFRIFFLTLAGLILSVIFVVAAVIALLPAMMLTKSAIEGTFNVPAFAVILDIISLFAIFFAAMFFEIYMLFMFPSVFSGEKKPYGYGKKIADRAFFRMIIPMTVFSLAIAVFQIEIPFMGDSILKIIVNWAFKSLFISILAGFIFVSYNNYRIEESNNNTDLRDG